MSKRAQERGTEERPTAAKQWLGMFGFKKLAERKANLFFRVGCFTRPENHGLGPEFCFREHKDTCARQRPETSNEFSRAAKG